MAKIISETILVTFSKIVKDSDTATEIAGSDIQQAIEQVAQELAGDTVVVEAVKA